MNSWCLFSLLFAFHSFMFFLYLMNSIYFCREGEWLGSIHTSPPLSRDEYPDASHSASLDPSIRTYGWSGAPALLLAPLLGNASC